MDENKTRRELREEMSAEPVRRTRKRKTPLELLLRDILTIGVILVAFAFFHHVLPRMAGSRVEMPTPVSLTTPKPTETRAPEQTPPSEEPTPPSDEPETSPAPTPEPTPDPMDWRSKFADHFTDEVVVTDHSYTSPNIAINIEKYVTEDPSLNAVFVADIYVADLACFQTYWAMGRLVYYGEESAESLARNSGAILSINGDYADSQRSGFLVRNGELYYDDPTTNDICVLYYDGTMETCGAGEYSVEDVLARGPYQVWKFGPKLLDENGQPCTDFNTTGPIKDVNPRSGVGYYEPGHYCFVVVDGRQSGYSYGMRIERFAQVFADLGCTAAYNLDGGQSSIMTFRQSIFNHPYLGGRPSGDVLLIREVGEEQEG